MAKYAVICYSLGVAGDIALMGATAFAIGVISKAYFQGERSMSVPGSAMRNGFASFKASH